jgi:Xaa-Pro aminopeptidase
VAAWDAWCGKLRPEAAQPALIGDKASLAIEAALPSGAAVRAAPAGALKAIKNGTELAGFRAAHVRDGAALARYFAWLEHALAQGEDVDEVRGAGVLEGFRRCVRRRARK